MTHPHCLTQAKGNQPESSFNDENLRMVVADLFAAVMVTTSTTLAWALLLMILHPDVQREPWQAGWEDKGGQVAPGPWLVGTPVAPSSAWLRLQHE
jgi:cytochrome P450